MRYALVIPDGAADRPHPDLDGRTPLEAATLPAMDRMAREGYAGRAVTVPEGMPPGSDVANLALLGYNPSACYTGRAPLEAAALGIELGPDQAVFRANTVTLTDGRMVDYAAGHIPTEQSRRLIEEMTERLDLPGVHLHPGVAYRHLAVFDAMARCIPERSPPHDILDQPAGAHHPVGGAAQRLLALEARTVQLLAQHPINETRRAAGEPEVTQLWLWGGGVMPELPPFVERWGVRGGLISAVDLLRGIAALAGLERIDVPGATGYYDTDYAGKGRAALACLARAPYVCVHVEAPDEAGHAGDAAEKVRALEAIDREIVAPLLAEAEASGDLRVLVSPDHATPLAFRTHDRDPVPFALWGAEVEAAPAEAYTESALADRAPIHGVDLMPLLMGLGQ